MVYILELFLDALGLRHDILLDATLWHGWWHSDGLRLHAFLPVDLVAVADSDFEFSFGFFLDVSHCTSLSALPRTISATISIVCVLTSVFLVYAVGFVCSLDAFDSTVCDSILFAEFSNLTGKHCTTVCQFLRSILSAHLLDDFRPLRGEGFHPLGQALAVVHDCLQRGKLVVVIKSVFCKNFLGVFPDALQLRAVVPTIPADR